MASSCFADSSCHSPPQSKDAARLRDKLLEHLPHAVLVGVSAPDCRQLLVDVGSIAESLLEFHAE